MALCTNAGFWQNDVAQVHPPQTHLSSKIYEVKYFYNADRAGSYPARSSPIHLHRPSRRGAGWPTRTLGCFLRGVCAVMGRCAHRRGLSALGFAAPTPRGPAPRGWVCTDSESARERGRGGGGGGGEPSPWRSSSGASASRRCIAPAPVLATRCRPVGWEGLVLSVGVSRCRVGLPTGWGCWVSAARCAGLAPVPAPPPSGVACGSLSQRSPEVARAALMRGLSMPPPRGRDRRPSSRFGACACSSWRSTSRRFGVGLPRSRGLGSCGAWAAPGPGGLRWPPGAGGRLSRSPLLPRIACACSECESSPGAAGPSTRVRSVVMYEVDQPPNGTCLRR